MRNSVGGLDASAIDNKPVNILKDNASDSSCSLWFGNHEEGAVPMASADSLFYEAGYGSSHDDSILAPTVDNVQYCYFVTVQLPASTSHTDYRFCGAVIEYEYPA